MKNLIELMEEKKIIDAKLYMIRQFEDKIALAAALKEKLSQTVHDYFLGDTRNFDIFQYLKKGGNNGRS